MRAAPQSWNRVPRSVPSRVVDVASRHDPLPALADGETCIAYGAGRSYGDVCLNQGGALLRTRRLDNFIAFDRSAGVLSCEAGATIARIARFPDAARLVPSRDARHPFRDDRRRRRQ